MPVPTCEPDLEIGKDDSVNVTLRISKDEVSGMVTVLGPNAPALLNLISQFDASAQLKFKGDVADAVNMYCAEYPRECGYIPSCDIYMT